MGEKSRGNFPVDVVICKECSAIHDKNKCPECGTPSG